MEEFNSANELTAAVNVWMPGPRTDGGDQEHLANSSPRERVDEFWTGPECGFLNAVRLALEDHFPPSLVREPDRQAKQSPLSDLLDQLCEEFAPEVQAAERLVSESHGFEPHGVFQSKAWQQRLQDHTQQDRTSLSADQSERRNALGQKLFGNDFRTQHDSRMLRFAMLAAAIAHASRAAWTLRTSGDANDQNLPNGFAADTVASMRCVCGVWPLLTGSLPVEDLKTAMPEPAHEHTATIAMRRLLVPDQADIRGIPTSAWLTVLHLVRWLLAEESETADTPAEVLLQTIDGLTNQGRSISLNLQTFQESHTGCFIDLVNTGLVLPDADMLQSLNIAWEISSGTLRNRCVEERRVLALRLHFDVRSEDQKRGADESCCDVRELMGDSAGGMAGLAIYAVADGKTPEVWVTGSFSLRRQDMNQRITVLNDIVVSAVATDTLGHKVVGAAAARCRYFLLAADQLDEDLERQAGHNGIRLIPLPQNGFDDGRQQLTTNAKLAEILEPLNQAIVQAWDTTPLDKPSGSAAGAKASAAYLQKPSPYVEPHLAELRKDQLMDRSDELVRSPDRKNVLECNVSYEPLAPDECVPDSVTPENETAIAEAEILEMLRRSAKERRIIIAADANAGKTVFSKRLAAFIAQGRGIEELFDGQPPLVLRWEQGPVKDSDGWPTSVELVRDQIVAYLKSNGVTDNEVERNLPTLLEQRRIVLILDSADKAGDEIVERVIANLYNHHELANCWIVVTGRSCSFSTEQVRELFNDGWKRFTILPFTTHQQETYLRSRGKHEGKVVAGPLQESQNIECVFEDYEQSKEHLGVAGVLEEVRDIFLTRLDRSARINVDHQGEESEDADRLGPLNNAEVAGLVTKYQNKNAAEIQKGQVKPNPNERSALDKNKKQSKWLKNLIAIGFLCVVVAAISHRLFVTGEKDRQPVKEAITAESGTEFSTNPVTVRLVTETEELAWHQYVPPKIPDGFEDVPMFEKPTETTPNLSGMRDFVFRIPSPFPTKAPFEEVVAARLKSPNPFQGQDFMLYSDRVGGIPQQVQFTESSAEFLRDCTVVCFVCRDGFAKRMNVGRGDVDLPIKGMSDELLQGSKGFSLFVFAYPVDHVAAEEYGSGFIIPTVIRKEQQL